MISLLLRFISLLFGNVVADVIADKIIGEKMELKDIKEIINLHEKLSKNKKANKEVLAFLEKQIKKETHISLEDIKILLDTFEKVKTEFLKIAIKDVIEGKPLEKPVYVPSPYIPEKPFDPKPYWTIPPISDSVGGTYYSFAGATNTSSEEGKQK